MKNLLKTFFIFTLAIFVSPLALALDFIANDKFNPQTAKDYTVQSTDTIAGYPVFAPEGDWTIYNTFMGAITSGTRKTNQPFLYIERYQNSKWIMAQAISVNTGASNGLGWEGDPCSGNKIIKN